MALTFYIMFLTSHFSGSGGPIALEQETNLLVEQKESYVSWI